MCAAVWGRRSRGPGCVRRGFLSSRFLVLGGWGWGGPVVLLLLVKSKHVAVNSNLYVVLTEIYGKLNIYKGIWYIWQYVQK